MLPSQFRSTSNLSFLRGGLHHNTQVPRVILFLPHSEIPRNPRRTGSLLPSLLVPPIVTAFKQGPRGFEIESLRFYGVRRCGCQRRARDAGREIVSEPGRKKKVKSQAKIAMAP